ncbi:MAG: hypothetical protein C4519_17620 [Desulfobacteraceae bacterium]|nr:MAG: hypothetical protein C4519_17620 [Desulfobacteraceae bacterium]
MSTENILLYVVHRDYWNFWSQVDWPEALWGKWGKCGKIVLVRVRVLVLEALFARTRTSAAPLSTRTKTALPTPNADPTAAHNM